MSALAAAGMQMHARLEAALGEDAGSVTGKVFIRPGTDASEDERMTRALLSGLIDAEDIDDTLGALRGCAHTAVQAIAIGGDPVYAIESALTQLLAVGVIYGRRQA